MLLRSAELYLYIVSGLAWPDLGPDPYVVQGVIDKGACHLYGDGKLVPSIMFISSCRI